MRHTQDELLSQKDFMRFVRWTRYLCIGTSLIPVYFLLSESLLVGAPRLLTPWKIVSLENNPLEYSLVLLGSFIFSALFWFGRFYLIQHLQDLIKKKR